MTSDPTTCVKDLRPGLKNLNVIFIVLEIGESAVLVSDHHPTINRNGKHGIMGGGGGDTSFDI